MVQQLRDFHDDAVFGLHGVGRIRWVECRCRLRLRWRKRWARDVVFRFGRHRLARRARSGHLSTHARNEQMHGAHLFAVDPAIEHACFANADLARTIAQRRVAPDQRACGTGNAPVDAVFAAVLYERLCCEGDVVEFGRRHVRASDAQLFGQRVGHAHQCAIEHLGGVVSRQPIRQRAGTDDQTKQRCCQRTQQMQAQADGTVASTLGRS